MRKKIGPVTYVCEGTRYTAHTAETIPHEFDEELWKRAALQDNVEAQEDIEAALYDYGY